MEIIGFGLAIVMGITLGLLGGGGSILSVPILVYVLGIEPMLGTAYSLFVVGITALIGGWRKHKEQLVEWKIGLTFAVPSLIAVFLTRLFLVPFIPDVILTTNNFVLTKDISIMVFFGLIMLLAAYSMIKGRKESENTEVKKPKLLTIVLEGALVGTVTGLVGAGGGFLIVPALVLLVGMPIKKAIGTSLVIIAIKSLIGFVGDIGAGQNIDWVLLSSFTAFSIIGMFIGIYLGKFFKANQLKKGFGWFVLIMAIFIIGKELIWNN